MLTVSESKARYVWICRQSIAWGKYMCFTYVDLQTVFRFEVILTLVALEMNGQMIGVEGVGWGLTYKWGGGVWTAYSGAILHTLVKCKHATAYWDGARGGLSWVTNGEAGCGRGGEHPLRRANPIKNEQVCFKLNLWDLPIKSRVKRVI